MSQKFTTEPKDDTICSSCYCKNQKFLHHVWDETKDHKLCTSCVLFSNKMFFCPTCFGVHDRPLTSNLVRCCRCGSYSHSRCISANASPSGGTPVCSTCIDPKRLIFDLKQLKLKGDNGYYKGLDMEAARLLLTAAKIVEKSLFMAHDDAHYSYLMSAAEALMEKKKVIGVLEGFSTVRDDGPSLLDSSDDSDSERMQRLSIRGANP